MGERGYFGIRYNGKDVFMYTHSSTIAMGETCYSEIRDYVRKHGVSALIELFLGMELVNPSRKPTSTEIDTLKPYTNLNVASQSTDDWYCLTHKLQGSIMEMLKVGYMKVDLTAITKDVWEAIERVYVLDLDNFTYKHYDFNGWGIVTLKSVRNLV